jgi:hypothetical protein
MSLEHATAQALEVAARPGPATAWLLATTPALSRELCPRCHEKVELLTLAEVAEFPGRADTDLCRRCYGEDVDDVTERDREEQGYIADDNGRGGS